ncbi:ACP S-malonyltransferase [Thiothrix fructosivorans]|uniref:Malonyl CoA-acyl carrier protein transacylase n=1 Tax=Thiothrix fructosivorans TaxID=111770 RepID=A0A8B0SJI4_9GAMM|nr:ACP S-malonyltransferase [Thiothrix fructosivorans]MBO0613868.1 ACP S-malonyltransferase [Thiothrix fructosivorans]QTX10238.1 ACP S-malonyltransferase [Thiothrix fructosivorans]
MTIAGIFPGQGSQSLGMLSALGTDFADVRNTFQEASEVLGRDLWQLAQEGTEVALNSTENTQPLMLAAGVAVWRVWLAQGGCQPVALAGHSLGEYSALVAAGALDFADAVSLVAERARLMQSAVADGEGAMAAILGLDDAQIVAGCEQAAQNDVVEAVNFNSPGQVVIAGSAVAIDRAIQVLTEMGAKKAIKLSVSVPSHCALMKPAAEKLAIRLAATAFNPAQLPVLHNVDAAARTDVDATRTALEQQLYRPVRWVDTIQGLQNAYGVTAAIEFGPGKVLTGLNKRIDRKLGAVCILDSKTLEEALKLCEETAA